MLTQAYRTNLYVDRIEQIIQFRKFLRIRNNPGSSGSETPKKNQKPRRRRLKRNDCVMIENIAECPFEYVRSALGPSLQRDSRDPRQSHTHPPPFGATTQHIAGGPCLERPPPAVGFVEEVGVCPAKEGLGD